VLLGRGLTLVQIKRKKKKRNLLPMWFQVRILRLLILIVTGGLPDR